jgi:hypothetical protein
LTPDDFYSSGSLSSKKNVIETYPFSPVYGSKSITISKPSTVNSSGSNKSVVRSCLFLKDKNFHTFTLKPLITTVFFLFIFYFCF